MEGDTSDTIPFPTHADAVRVFLYGKHWNISSPQCSFQARLLPLSLSVKGYTAYATVYVGGYWKTNFASEIPRA